MYKLRIFIDPQLVAAHGPEIHWTWRLLLTGIGWAWEEVSSDSPCDIAFVSEFNNAPTACLYIRANPEAWSQPGVYRLGGVGHYNGLAYPLFVGESPASYSDEVTPDRVICRRYLIFDMFWLVTGQEERYWSKDKHGFFDLTGTVLRAEQVLRQVLASQISTWFEKSLSNLGYPSPLPRWPYGKQAAAGVGHDVDYPEVKRWLEPFRIALRQGSRGIRPALSVLTGQRDHWQFEAWVDLEKHLQTRSAFYFVPRHGSLFEYATGTPDSFYDITSPRFRQLFRHLIDEGFEVGLHASYLAYQNPEKFAAEKQKLEEASGQLIVGNRHHYWHLNPANIEETLLIHEQIGLKYDTSLIHNRYVGWRRGLSQPFFPFHQALRRELKTLQVPTAWMDDQLFGQRADNPGDRLEILRDLADRTANHQGCLLIDIHDYVFDEALFPGWTQTYVQLWEYLLSRQDFWFATPAQIAQHWTTRYETIVRASQGLNQGML